MALEQSTTSYQKRALILIGIVLTLRLVYAAIFPSNPAGDEAYYWDWGRQLDYGYYSKPPFIAWLYAFVDWIGGGSLFAIRATAAILGTGAIWLLYRLTTALFDEKAGWIAVLIAFAAPANSVLSFFLTIDAPLLVCWTIALWMFWRFVNGTGKAGSLAVLFLALAIGHLSKQMMMIFPILAILFLAIVRDTRSLFKKPALWLVLLGSFVALIPPLIWNSQNGWITFEHTGHHFETQKTEENVILERAEDFLSFLGTQIGVLSPITGFFLFALCLGGLKGIAKAPTPVRFLLVFGALPLAAMLLLALRQELQPNWPAVYYVSGLALTAAWFAGHLSPSFPPARWRAALKPAIGIGTALALFFYFGSFGFDAVGKTGHKADPDRRLLGHDLVAAEFQKIRESIPNSDELFLVGTAHRDVTSQLAFGLPDQPRVYRWENTDRVVSQYELWNNPLEDGFTGKDGLILVPLSSKMPSPLDTAFDSVEKAGEFEVVLGYDRTWKYSVFLGKGLKTWPHVETAKN